jgi:hypothetical protein
MASASMAILTALPNAGGCRRIAAIARDTGLPKRRIASLVSTLNRRGLVAQVSLGCYARTARADRLLAEGTAGKPGPRGPHDHPRRRAGDLRARAWRALRALKKATLPELLELACRGTEKAAESNVGRYLKALEAHGVVAALERRAPGILPTSPGFRQWLLLRDLGPRAPAWNPRTGRLHDPNAGIYLERAS